MTKELQPYSTFTALDVARDRETPIKLSGGETIPYVYSLGINSTVPYVKLLGSSMGQKLFSWTEQIIVPAGEMVTVANGSYHPGDIWIQSGADPSALPARVSIPVGLVQTQVGKGLFQNVPTFGLDTRRARRAFVQGIPANSNAVEFINQGKSRLRSHFVLPSPPSEVRTPTFTTTVSVPPGVPGLLALGKDARPGDGVHALLDEARFIWDAAINFPDGESGAVYYVLEYI